MTNNSIFTRVLALMLCLIMLVGTLTACLNQVDHENHVGTTTNGGVVTTDPTTKPTTTTTTTPTTGDVVEDDPVEDPVDHNEVFSASTDILSDGLIYGTLASDVVIGGTEMGALVPADVKVEAGASNLALSVKKVDEVLFSDALSTLDVHINGVALDNTVPMIVKLGAILEAGLGATELKLYHTENGVDNLMTRVNSPSDFAIHNQYYYNAETGEVTIYVASFSVFYALKSEADVWDGKSDTTWYNENDTEFTLTTAEQLAGFRDLVDGGNTFAGKVVKLGADIDLNNINFDPIGYGYVHLGGQAFMGTFDGGNHIIYNLYEQGWDLESETGKDYTYSTAGAGLFASIMGTVENPAIIKNLAVSGADIKMECVDMGIVVGYAQGVCHFENIIVTNSKIANYQRATGGVVGEVCFGPYGVEHNNENFSHTFKNIVVDSSVTVGSLWGDFDNLNGGVIGGKWGDATVKMEDITVAVTLDAYSDVTSAYQWYAYRRSGMLIGHTEQNSPKKAETADAPFLVCENVKVYYGDWVNYTYCQFEHTNNPGYRYPWVRVQAGLNCGAYSNPRYGNPTDSVGNKVTTDTHTHAEGEGCHVLIKFDQLYGGGQGVYGKADHEGVTIVDKNTKTIYVHNNANWTNLKLFYWYDTTWTNVVDGIELVEENGIYKVDVPAYAYAFKIVANEGESQEFVLAELGNNGDITLGNTPCEHEYDNACDTTCNVCEETREITHTAGETVVENRVESSCTATGSYDNVVYCTVCEVEISRETITVDATGHTVVTDKAVAPTCTATGLTEGSHCSVCNAVIVAQTVVNKLAHTEVVDEAVAPTCTATGLTEGSHCSVCNTVLVTQKTVAATGHSYSNACDTTCNNNCGTTRTVGDHVYNDSPYNCDECQTPADTITIYFENTQNWTTLNLNYGELSYTVALNTLTKATNGVNDVYTLAIPKHVDNITISGGTSTATPAMTVSTLVAGNVYALATDKTMHSTKYEAGYKTVKFVDEWTWTANSFKVYYWYSDNNGTWNTVDWTGRTAMTREGTTNTYSFNVPAYADGYTVSGDYEIHTLQTVDQSISNLDTVTYHPIDCVIIDSQKHDGMMTIFYQNDWWYTNVYLYDWDIATDKGTTAWPGNKMIKVGWNGTYDIYAITIKEGHGFKINDGNTNDIRETENITSGAYDGKMYTGGKSNDKIYVNVNVWDKNSARFAAYFFNDSSNVWVSMTYNKQGGVYECAKQTGYSKVIFCRMNQTSTANNWNNKWNQTGNLTVPTTSKNVFTVTAWDGQTTGWNDR